jgi:hypothetical protein
MKKNNKKHRYQPIPLDRITRDITALIRIRQRLQAAGLLSTNAPLQLFIKAA